MRQQEAGIYIVHRSSFISVTLYRGVIARGFLSPDISGLLCAQARGNNFVIAPFSIQHRAVCRAVKVQYAIRMWTDSVVLTITLTKYIFGLFKI